MLPVVDLRRLLRRAGAVLGLGAARDWILDRPWIAMHAAVAGTEAEQPAPAGEPIAFAGDSSLWVQPADRVVRNGDMRLGWSRLERIARSGVPCTSASTTNTGAHSTSVMRFPLSRFAGEMTGEITTAEQLIVDFSRIYPARSVAARPRHKRGDGRQYHRYRPGALSGDGIADAAIDPAPFSLNHQRDIWSSFRGSRSAVPCDEVVEHPVLFVTREGEESRNLFHSVTDLLNAFEAIQVAALASPAAPITPADLEVVLLDHAPGAPFDALWSRVCAPVRGVRRVSDFRGRRVRFRRAIFSASGYHSLLLAFLTTDAPTGRLGMLDAFAGRVRRAHGLGPDDLPTAPPTRVTVVARRPYDHHTWMDRRWEDERACVGALESLTDVRVRLLDFATMSIAEQIHVAAHTDVMVGIHGAALTHALWMPPDAAIVEVDTRAGDGWRMFRHIAGWTGRDHAIVFGTERAMAGGSAVAVDPRDVAEAVQAAITRRLLSRA